MKKVDFKEYLDTIKEGRLTDESLKWIKKQTGITPKKNFNHDVGYTININDKEYFTEYYIYDGIIELMKDLFNIEIVFEEIYEYGNPGYDVTVYIVRGLFEDGELSEGFVYEY
jgi:hypothetical protein